MKKAIIAIDGPAGSGKSTVSKLLAERLGLLYIDTGAMYRALTVRAIDRKTELTDEDALVALARSSKIDLEDQGGSLRVLIDGTDVTDRIRALDVTESVKFVARVPDVRAEMVNTQRSIAETKGAVMEGRDIGTVVFPDATYKFYLDADVEERASRRYRELKEKGMPVSMQDIRQGVIARDRSDMERSCGPLKKADDAVVVDTTSLTIQQVVDRLMAIIKDTEHRKR